MKTLYEVQVSVTVLVLAESAVIAADLAVDAVYERDGGAELKGHSAKPLDKIAEIPAQWKHCIVYGDNPDELTGEEFFAYAE